ncbi:MAG TPA: nucleotidyl transferase AbiEii/AbiGii toxin family protein [Myxococcota bacterium]|nr:nucleotidyl transferase AbiEii/AbiGii toxin family protein [Myxococcota bacterium]
MTGRSVVAPPSEGKLTKYVLTYAKERGLDPGRVRRWISYMALGGVLQRRQGPGPARFVFKGGVALELRLRTRARATRDLDLILNDGSAGLVEALEEAFEAPYEGFVFRRKGRPQPLTCGALRLDVLLTFKGKPWGTVQVDIARYEGNGTEVEPLTPIALADFGLSGPHVVPCISLRHHIAHKLHGVSLPPAENRPNERFKDLIDLLILKDLVQDLSELHSACRAVFEVRGTHPWPPILSVPPHWDGPFVRMARETGLGAYSLQGAVGEVRAFVARVCAASSAEGRDAPTGTDAAQTLGTLR